MLMRSPSSSSTPGEDALFQSLQVSSQAWATFDFSGKYSQLDKISAQTREQKEHSQAARKQLGETTKQFKKSVKSMELASSTLKLVGSLEGETGASIKAMDVLAKECRQTIKRYQEEIDNLTRRCKASETGVSSVYMSMEHVSDPVALLDSAIDQIQKQQAQIGQLLRTVDEVNKEMTRMEQTVQTQKESNPAPSSSSNREEKEELLQLRREVAEYEVEFRGLKNQDITIRKLEAKIAELEDGAEEILQKEVEKAQTELAETEGRRAAEALEREAAMERRVQTLELQLKAERAGREATQAHLLEADEGAGEREAAWEAQRRILVDDSERLRESLHETARERDELRLRVAATNNHNMPSMAASPSSGGMAMADMISERNAYEAEVSELSHTANSLREELRIKEEGAQEEKRSIQASMERLERDRINLTAKVSSLESQMAATPSQKYIDSIKRELRILKRLEYNAEDAERDPEMTGEEDQDFEGVLVSKLKRVESELVRERNTKVGLSRECDQLKRNFAEAEQARNDAETVVASLEKDLHRALDVSAAAASTPSSTRKLFTIPSKSGEDPAMLQNILDPSSPAPSTPVAPPSTPSKSASEKANDDHSVATIVMAQRDRLRARCDTLEAERDSFKVELQAQVQSSESLKVDNTKLYEKVRYLQTYQTRKGPSQDRDLDLEALEQRYEASVDPFRQFSRTERQRKMKEMSAMERVVYIVAKTVLGTKEMRTALFFYVCVMHLLVFFTTYHNSSGECDDTAHHDMLSHLPPDAHVRIAEAASSTVTGG